jgi:DNA-binding response OmpR family regulator
VSDTRVLVIEDDRFLRRVHEAGLRQHGYTVLTAVDGEEGLSKTAMKAGATSYLLKSNLTVRALVTKVEETLATRRTTTED